MSGQIHWREKKEAVAMSWQLHFTLFIACNLPPFLKKAIAAFVTLFYFIGAKNERKISRDFLRRVSIYLGKPMPTLFDSYKHFLSFSLMLLDKFYCWNKKTLMPQIAKQDDDLKELYSRLDNGEGCVLICSHCGNVDVLWSRVIFNETHTKRKFDVYPIADISGTSHFNEFLKKSNPKFAQNIVDANSIGPETAEFLSKKIAEGNIVIIAGDRVSANAKDRTIPVTFIGEQARFPIGAFALCGILNAPVYFMFALRAKDLDLSSVYKMHITKAKTSMQGNYSERKNGVPILAEEFVRELEKHCLEHHLQWYNFYDFWAESKGDVK